jgi:hypothetical protein
MTSTQSAYEAQLEAIAQGELEGGLNTSPECTRETSRHLV